MKESIDYQKAKEFLGKYDLADLILLGAHADFKIKDSISEALGIAFDYIDIDCDTYDGSLEIRLTKNTEVDIDSLCTRENIDKIIEITGSRHFWVNLCEQNENDEYIRYLDFHAGYVDKPEYWHRHNK